MFVVNSQESQEREGIPDFDLAPAEAVLQWALEKFSPNIALASSFQAEESVLIDMLYRLRGSDFRIFTLDTGRLNQETYECMDAIRDRYGISVEVYFPDAARVEEVVRQHGMNLFYRSVEERKLCCAIRKVEPLNRALKNLTAWMTGLRREQAASRAVVQKVEIDADHGGILKVNPLADWRHDDVWRYIRQHDVPFNSLHTQGYPSIGCAPCTRAVKPGEDLRAGRWWWEVSQNKECGLHVLDDLKDYRVIAGNKSMPQGASMSAAKIHTSSLSTESPARQMAAEVRRSGGLKARAIEKRHRRPAAAVEIAVVNLLARERELPVEELVNYVADFLYHEEIQAGAWTVDLVLFSSRLFVPEARKVLKAGNGELWNIDGAKN